MRKQKLNQIGQKLKQNIFKPIGHNKREINERSHINSLEPTGMSKIK